MVYVYILQSLSSGKYYIGVSEDLDRRVEEHNQGQSPSTRRRGPWELVYTEEYALRTAALARERQLKAWKSHAAISELIQR